MDTAAELRAELLRLLREGTEVRGAVLAVLEREAPALLALIREQQGRERLERPTL